MNRQRRVWLIALVSFMSITAFLAITAVLLQSAQETREIGERTERGAIKAEVRDELLREIRIVAKQIESCTTPGQPCSERNRKATEEAVEQIATQNAAAAAAASTCALQIKPTPSYKRVYECTVKTLQEEAAAADRRRGGQ